MICLLIICNKYLNLDRTGLHEIDVDKGDTLDIKIQQVQTSFLLLNGEGWDCIIKVAGQMFVLKPHVAAGFDPGDYIPDKVELHIYSKTTFKVFAMISPDSCRKKMYISNLKLYINKIKIVSEDICLWTPFAKYKEYFGQYKQGDHPAIKSFGHTYDVAFSTETGNSPAIIYIKEDDTDVYNDLNLSLKILEEGRLAIPNAKLGAKVSIENKHTGTAILIKEDNTFIENMTVQKNKNIIRVEDSSSAVILYHQNILTFDQVKLGFSFNVIIFDQVCNQFYLSFGVENHFIIAKDNSDWAEKRMYNVNPGRQICSYFHSESDARYYIDGSVSPNDQIYVNSELVTTLPVEGVRKSPKFSFSLKETSSKYIGIFVDRCPGKNKIFKLKYIGLKKASIPPTIAEFESYSIFNGADFTTVVSDSLLFLPKPGSLVALSNNNNIICKYANGNVFNSSKQIADFQGSKGYIEFYSNHSNTAVFLTSTKNIVCSKTIFTSEKEINLTLSAKDIGDGLCVHIGRRHFHRFWLNKDSSLFDLTSYPSIDTFNRAYASGSIFLQIKTKPDKVGSLQLIDSLLSDGCFEPAIARIVIEYKAPKLMKENDHKDAHIIIDGKDMYSSKYFIYTGIMVVVVGAIVLCMYSRSVYEGPEMEMLVPRRMAW